MYLKTKNLLISCKNCHKIYEKENYEQFVCQRCKHKVNRRVKYSLQISIALVICAMLLFIPAMLYPMMQITTLGVKEGSTIIEGTINFLDSKDYFIAFVIFAASIVIPLVKLCGLLFIFLSLSINIKMQNRTKNKIFKFVEAIGKWSMIDIYVVALLASVIQLDEVLNIQSGVAATSFALVVILTMIAAHNFDTRIIWDE